MLFGMLPILNHLGSRLTAIATLVAVSVALSLFAGCSDNSNSSANGARKTIVVTYSILGSLVTEAVGDKADVIVLIPNGFDPHEWEPSARDIEQLNGADLIVRNGLDLEGGMQDALDLAQENGRPTFVASDHITIRIVGEGEGLPTGDPDQAPGAQDPHLWMDPITLQDVMSALGPVLVAQGIEVTDGVASVIAGLDELHTEVRAILAAVPEANRKLVTGHESLGYFAKRYGFQLIGAIIPSLTPRAAAPVASSGQRSSLVNTRAVGVKISSSWPTFDRVSYGRYPA